METPILNLITDCLVPLVTAVVGWLAGSRKRRNDALKSMQDSIDILSTENKRLIEDHPSTCVTSAAAHRFRPVTITFHES